MKKQLLMLIGCVSLVGCSTDNVQQVFHHSVLHGGFIKLGVPLGSSGALGVQAGIGYYATDDGINPTFHGTNVYSAPMSFATHSRNKQTGFGGSATTNSTASTLQGSDDSSAINLGSGTVTDEVTTNQNISASSK
jgi:hypothetical protein